jgi:hypothetical protein
MSASGCYGYLYFSRQSIRYDVFGPPKFKDHSFERSRADIVKAGDPGPFRRKFPNDIEIQFKSGQSERFDHVNVAEVEKIQKAPVFGNYLLPRDPLMLAFTDFDRAVAAAGGRGTSAVQVAGNSVLPGAPAAPGAASGFLAQPGAGLSQPSSPAGFYADTQSDFDTLDGVIVDARNGKLTLFGHRAGSGSPRSVPYLDYLAAALESNNPTFSLEWTPDSKQSIDRAFNMADQDLTNRLAGTVDSTGHVTKRGEWWYQMLGANVHEGMDKMSLWTAVFAVTNYPNAARVMKAVDAIERAGNAGQLSNPSLINDFFNATVNISMPGLAFATFARVSSGAHNGDAQARETYFSWGLRGMAIAYRVDENRYVNRYHEVKRGHDDYWALAKTLELSQDDTVAVQKNAFGALVGNRTFVHITPDIMREVLGISPMVVPVYQGLPSNSLLARVAFDADVFGKNLMDMPEIKSKVPAYRTYFEWRQTVPRAPAAEGHTWFAPDGFELIESADGGTVRFGKTPIRIHMERYDRGGASGRESVADPLLKQYADELTALYDPLAANFPVLLDLRESMKVMAVADWLKHRGIKMSLPAQGRGVWNPPAQFPGVIHMEIAVKPAAVGEVMSASGGIDFRVDKNWNLIKQRIEEQPGPPPANHTTVDYDPSSGTVAAVKPPQPPPIVSPAVAPMKAPVSTTALAPGRPIFDCAGDAAKVNRLISGLPVQKEAIDRAQAALDAAREDAQHDSAEARDKWIEAAVKMLASQANSIADSSEKLLAAEEGVKSNGIPAAVAARTKFLEKIKEVYKLSEDLEKATKVVQAGQAGKAYGDTVFVQQTSRDLMAQLSQARALFVDSGIAEEAGAKLALFLWGPIGEAGFNGVNTGLDLLAATSAGIISAGQANEAAQNLDVMRSQYTRAQDRIYELQQELTQDCPNAPAGQTVTPNATDPLARPVPPPVSETPPTQPSVPKSSATSFALKGVEAQGDFYILTSSGAKVSAQEAAQVPIDNGARVFTGPNSHATLTLPDGTKWTIGPDSELQLDDFVYDPDMSLRKAAVQMLKGAFRWVTGKTVGSAAQVQLNVRQSLNVGIRGTDFDLYVAPDGSGYARLYSGQLEITEIKTKFTFLLNAGQMVTFGADGACSRPMPLQP